MDDNHDNNITNSSWEDELQLASNWLHLHRVLAISLSARYATMQFLYFGLPQQREGGGLHVLHMVI